MRPRLQIREDSDGYNTDNSEASVESMRFSDENGELDGPDSEQQADFGILFDIDGVLARGSTPLDQAKEAIKHLTDHNGNLKVPVSFVTNGCCRSADKAAEIQKWLNIPVTPDMVIHAPTPARLLKEYHEQHVLVIGQEHRKEIAEELGFTKVCTIEDVKQAYPLLDMVDHQNRKDVATGSFADDHSFPTVEAVLLIGEPTRWESCLQLLVDLLVTQGKPSSAPKSMTTFKQLPIIACNMDLVFMHQACMPRYGHGAFLVCLEALYKKITGTDLQYTALIGKPCEITYRYAEHTIAHTAKRLGIHRRIRKLYFIGDNPNVDIVGANLYDRYLKRMMDHKVNGNEEVVMEMPCSRHIPNSAELYEQTVEQMDSLLVGTGVYNPDHAKTQTGKDSVYHGHRDIEDEPHLAEPTRFVDDVYHGVIHVLEKENFWPAEL